MFNADLPEWVWDLVMGLQQFEDEHPQFFRSVSGGYEVADCGHQTLLNTVPDEVRFAATVLRHRAVREGR